MAATEGRAFVTPDDIKNVAHPVLAHRLILTAEAELNQPDRGEVLDDVLARRPLPVPSRRATDERA